MRKIVYRGLDKDGNWVYGDLMHGVGVFHEGNVYILPCVENLSSIPNCDPLDGVRVDPETVGQLTGLRDKNGQDIYEGDLLKSGDFTEEVYWMEDIGAFMVEEWQSESDSPKMFLLSDSAAEGEVVGNIHMK